MRMNHSVGGITMTSQYGNSEIKSKDSSDILCKINSYMIALVLASELIANVLKAVLDVTGTMRLIFAGTIIISYSTAIVVRHKFRANIYIILLFFYTLALFSISFLQNGINHNMIHLIEFLTYGLNGFLLMLLPYKTEWVLRNISRFAVLFLMFYSQIMDHIDLDVASYDRIKMGASYSILPIVAATILYVYYYREESRVFNVFNAVVYIANLMLLLLLISQGTRGAVVSLAVLIFFMLWNKKAGNQPKFSAIKRYALLVGVLIMAVAVVAFSEQILKVLFVTLNSMGISIAAINKSYLLMTSRGFQLSVLNGRDYVYANALEVFKESPVFGVGIGGFPDIYNYWPHNIFLHLFSELGLLLSLPYVLIIGKGVMIIMQQWPSDENDETAIMIMFLFTISVIRLMFSSRLWKEQAFWMFLVVVCSYARDRQKEHASKGK